ncbi:MAG: cell division protein FtsW [Candidatus Kapabacteria bacterium]|nr:cell division protein FtsW [Ignavibacteriota bacterium]MCW5886284.1 cell division protein FtsW [Candidatus Kapabacteria bacterium]
MKTKGHIDWLILIPIIALMLFSISFVYTASASNSAAKFGDAEHLFWNHSLRVFLGIGIIFVFARIDYHVYAKISKLLMVVGILSLIAVFFFGINVKGASRWLSLGPFSFQPSELVKLVMVIHFSALLARKQAFIKDFERGFFPFIIWTVIICFLIALQPNFSTMMVIFLIAVTMMFIGNTNLLHLGATFAVGLVAGIVFFITADYRLNRLKSFLGFGEGTENEAVSYQLNQSLIALGNGGIFGVGVGQNRQSYHFLPESYGDFIFAIIGEEYGFLGLVLVLGIFMVVFWRGMLVAKKAPDNFGYFLAIGVIITFAIYVFVNAGVNTGLLPTTGVPMPFVSYGGTAVLFYSAAIGILLNISAQAGIYPRADFAQPLEFNYNEEVENGESTVSGQVIYVQSVTGGAFVE